MANFDMTLVEQAVFKAAFLSAIDQRLAEGVQFQNDADMIVGGAAGNPWVTHEAVEYNLPWNVVGQVDGTKPDGIYYWSFEKAVIDAWGAVTNYRDAAAAASARRAALTPPDTDFAHVCEQVFGTGTDPLVAGIA